MRSNFFLVLIFSLCIAKGQENKNELGVSLFSIETYQPGGYAFGIEGYVNPLNAIIYKRAINEDFKLRSILTAEINASSYPNYRDECNDCGALRILAMPLEFP